MAQSNLPVNVSRGISNIITTQYFFAAILLKRDILLEEQGRTPTASMDVHGTIRLNPEWTKDFTTGEMVFLLCHECMHYMLGHCLRRGNRDADKWNWAADAWINETLINLRVGTFIEGGVRYPGAETMSVEQLYMLSPDDLEKGKGGGTLGNDIDDSERDQMTDAEAAMAEAHAKSTMAQASRAAEGMGGMDATFKAMVDQLIHVKTPWFQYLEQFMSKSTEDDFTWLTPDQDYLAMGLYIPGMGGEDACGELAIIVDESGSIAQEIVSYFGGHVNTVLESCKPEKVYVVHCTHKVVDTDEFTPDEFPIKLERKGSGGTDMEVGIKHVLKSHPLVDAIIVLTDGYTPFTKDPGIPVLWAMTTDKVAPYGQTIAVDIND